MKTILIVTLYNYPKTVVSHSVFMSPPINFRPPDKSVYWKIIFIISHSKHMLWVPKRTVSMMAQRMLCDFVIVIFHGSQISIAKKPYIFVIF